MFKTNREILENVPLAVNNENPILNMEEFFHQPTDRKECLGFPSVPLLQVLFEHDDKLVFHPELGIIEKDCNFRQKLIDP